MSIQYGLPSEFTCMILLETVIGKVAVERKAFVKEVLHFSLVYIALRFQAGPMHLLPEPTPSIVKSQTFIS